MHRSVYSNQSFFFQYTMLYTYNYSFFILYITEKICFLIFQLVLQNLLDIIISPLEFYNYFTTSMSSKEFKCPLCHMQYNKLDNLPRLLTMCGHTYCEKCVKSLIVKKKDMKYRICCPEDNCSLEFPSGKPTHFPKNLALLQVISKNKKNSLMALPQESFDISHIKQTQTNEVQFEGDLTGKEFLQMIGQLQDKKYPTMIEDKNTSTIYSDKNKLQEIDEKDFCLGHQKVKDVVCIEHMKKICASCAIFGQHKGHTFRSVLEVEKQSDQSAIKLHNLLQKKQGYDKILANQRQLEQQIAAKLATKAQLLKKQMREFYSKLLQAIKKSEKQTLKQIQKIINNTLNDINIVSTPNEDTMNAYSRWQSLAKLHLKILQSNSPQQKCQIVFGEGSRLKELLTQGQTLGSYNETQDKKILENSYKIIEGIELKADQQIFRVIDNCVYIQHNNLEVENKLSFLRRNKSENFLQTNYGSSRKTINYYTTSLEEGLFQQSIILQQKQQQTQKNFIQKSPSDIVCKTYRKSSEIHTDEQKTLVIDEKAKNFHKKKTLSSVSPMMMATDRMPFPSHVKKHSLPILKIPEKFEKLMKFGKGTQPQYIDITNAKVPQNMLFEIISGLPKDVKIKSLKLSRNNITDRFLQKIIDRLGGIISLNLSQNLLTDNSLKLIASKLIHLPNLKILNLSQNKIVQRRNKTLIQQIRSNGLSLTI